jgi:hypothetical protein
LVLARTERLKCEKLRSGVLLDRGRPYRSFSAYQPRHRTRGVAILCDYAAKWKKVHAFGAPAKGATLLNSFHITTDLCQCAVEVNPLKIGKYVPGCRLPIVDETKTAPPDVYLLLARNFLKEFRPKKRDYIMNGGEFIVPIPTPVVINKNNYAQYAK